MKVWKVVAFPSFDFNDINPATQRDWSATYFQFTVEHALRYATDKCPTNPEGIISLVEFETSPHLVVHKLNDKLFGSALLSGQEKASLAKRMLNFPPEVLLMQHLDGALILRDNEEETTSLSCRMRRSLHVI